MQVSEDLKSRQDGSYVNPNDADISGHLDRTVNELDLSASLTAELQPFDKYVALLTQSGTGAPVATVLDNEIGSIVWTRAGTGQYAGTLNGAFVSGSAVAIVLNPKISTSVTGTLLAVVESASAVGLSAFTDALAGTAADDELVATPVEIRVYKP